MINAVELFFKLAQKLVIGRSCGRFGGFSSFGRIQYLPLLLSEKVELGGGRNEMKLVVNKLEIQTKLGLSKKVCRLLLCFCHVCNKKLHKEKKLCQKLQPGSLREKIM
jgi:hypothetical protein